MVRELGLIAGNIVLADGMSYRDTRTMTHDPSETVSQFLETRRALVEAGNVDDVEKLDEALPDMAASDPGSALAIIEKLSVSDDPRARETAAIFVQHLFPARREQVADLLVTLLHDPNPDIARQALQTIDTVTQDPHLTATQAASRITELKSQAS